MGLNHNVKINEYIDEVCSRIDFREVHEEIEKELENHITELAEEYMDSGLDEVEAVDRALAQMGDSSTVGMELNRVHRPKTEWSIFILTFVMSTAGLLTNYIIQIEVDSKYILKSSFSLSIFINLLGFAILAGLYYFDYRKIRRFSKYIYWITLLVLMYFAYTGRMNFGSFRDEIVLSVPFLFAIALPGIFIQWDWGNAKNLLKAFSMLVIPVLLLLFYPSFAAALIYSIMFMVTAVVSGFKIRYAIITFFSGTGMFLYLIFTGAPYRVARFLTFINPMRDPGGEGYIYNLIHTRIISSKPFGAGYLFEPMSIPDINTNFIFTYIICAFGWIAGITLAALVVSYLVRITRAAVVVKSHYGRMLVSGITAIFAVKFLMNIPMSLGIGPIIGVGLPFISFGRIEYIINMAAVGLILSVYRRKNLSRNTCEKQRA